MEKMREKLNRFMAGRYGSDELNKVLLGVSIVLLVLTMFLRYRVIYLLALATLAYCYYRMFSRNIAKRYQENQKFLVWKNRTFRRFSTARQQRADKEHRYYRCPSCRQTVRVPKGKGKISIRCPRCSAEFIKRT